MHRELGIHLGIYYLSFLKILAFSLGKSLHSQKLHLLSRQLLNLFIILLCEIFVLSDSLRTAMSVIIIVIRYLECNQDFER